MTPVVCLITDRIRAGGRGEAGLVEQVGWAARAGVTLVQVRERDLDGLALLSLVRRCLAAVRGTRVRVLVNDRLDVALAAGAHGVHLRADSMPAARVRPACPGGFLIGRSVHARDEAVDAERAGGLDYLMFGTVFATSSKPGRIPAGPGALRELCGAVRLPVLAVGGVAVDNLREVAVTGAAGFAAIGLLSAESPIALTDTVARASTAFASGIR